MKPEEEKVSQSDLNPVEIVQRAVRGDQDAFTDLFHKLNAPVLNYVYRIVGDRPTAEDIVQDAFVRAHSRIEQLGPPWDFKSWVYRIAGNLAIDHLRQSRRFVDVEEVELMGDSTTRRPAEKKAHVDEQRRAVWNTLDGLPTLYRQALILREFNELSYKELSGALEVSYDAARQIVHRARVRFKELHGIRMLAAEARQRCGVLDEMLSAYRDGELPESELKKVRKHIKSCADCQAAENEMEKVSSLLAVIPPLIPTAAWQSMVLETVRRQASGIAPKSADMVHKESAGSSSGAQAGTGLEVGNRVSALARVLKIISTAWPLFAVPAVGLAAAAGLLLFANLGNGGSGGRGGGAEPSSEPSAEPAQTDVAAFLLETETGMPSPSGTPTPSPTSTASMTSSPTFEPPSATGRQNVKCRYGPDVVYDILTYLLKDHSALIVGRNQNDTWWYIERSDGFGQCWVWDGVVDVSGDLSQVPVVAAPPTPTATPSDVEAPVVEINLSPSGTGHPHDREQLTFSAAAQDNFGVERIEIWIKSSDDDTLIHAHTCTGVSSCVYIGGPYRGGILTYQARAFDAAGNEGRSLKHQIEVQVMIY